MRSILEVAREIGLKAQTNNSKIVDRILEELVLFDSEIRKDQERITIDAAIDNVCRSHHISNSRLHLDIACKLIKNTKTIED